MNMVTMFSLLFVYIFTKSVLEKNRSTLFYTGKAKQRCIALAIHSSDNNRKKKIKHQPRSGSLSE